MSHIFISYAHEDSNYAHILCAQMEEYGFDPWLDEDIEHGERWFKSISKAIEECAAFVVVMTPEADESIWVEKEIMIAIACEKPIFPILLRGKVFNLLISIQCTKLDKEHDYLPPLSFYQKLVKFVPRKAKLTPEEMQLEARRRVEEEETRREGKGIIIKPPPQVEPDPAIYDEIKKWERFTDEKETDFYGIAMLALALEAEGSYRSHKHARHQLRRACKIEPSVRDKKFMTNHYGWSEEQHKLLERILTDPKFFV